MLPIPESLIERLPKPFSRLARLPVPLPPSPHSVLFCLLLNRLLRDQHADFTPLRGKSICIRSKNPGLSLCFGSTRNHIIPLGFRHDATLTITASLRDFIRLAMRQEDPDTLFFARRLGMEGDTELGLWFKNTMDNIDMEGFYKTILHSPKDLPGLNEPQQRTSMFR